MARYKPAVITNCLRAVLMSHPSLKAEPVGSLMCLSEIQVDPERSDESFYYVRTESGEEGYCLKRYIAFRNRR